MAHVLLATQSATVMSQTQDVQIYGGFAVELTAQGG